jgi:alanine racemase
VPDLSIGRPTWAEINLDHLSENLQSVKTFVGADIEVMAVVKADAYGHGAVECAKRLSWEGVGWFAVATMEEAVELRQAGLAGRILVVGSVWPGQEREFLNFDITAQVICIEQAEALNSEAAKHDSTAKVHVKVDTGMNRVGFRPEDLQNAAERMAKFKNIEVEGIMSHFSSAEKLSENDFTDLQISKFADAIRVVHNAGLRPNFIDIANSPGAVMHPLARGRMVRIGGLLYGLAEDIIPVSVEQPIVKPIMSLFTRIAQIKTVPKGETIGYGRTFVAERDSVIATVPIGYNDGYRRGLSNKIHAIVNGKTAPVAGRISMDWTTLDVTDCGEVKHGDRVTIIGEDGDQTVSAKTLAEATDTISYEITCGIAVRVPRIYKSKVM